MNQVLNQVVNQPRSLALRRHPLRAPALIAIILLAFTLRVYKLDAQSLWYDEGVTADVAHRTLADLTRWTANDIQPPLYYYVVAAWGRLAGWTEWSLRFPSAFFGVLLIPLLALVTVRLIQRANAGLLAALLTALHPLLLYYSQEARMYALLTSLGALLGYCVLRIADDPDARRFYLFYILAAVAAIYTHYFAFFLLMALGLAFGFEQWRINASHRPSPLRATFAACRKFLLANLVILLLYLPWFTFLFTRLAVDTSYWQGQLKLWEALRSVAISFTSGQTVAETQAVWLLIPYGGITLMAIGAAWWYSGRALEAAQGNAHNGHKAGRRIFYYALPWLIIPVVAVLVLASFAPKFNARYVMIALPGLILLWAAGFSMILEKSDWRFVLRSLSPIAFLGLIFILATSLYAGSNWFFNPAFTKDDWRDIAAFLQTRIQPDETVILVSGHAWPVWHYYAPDVPVVRLPQLDVLDVNAVLTFENTAAPLRAAFAKASGKTGAWIVEWQDEVVDPTGIVPVQLELAGREKGQPTPFWKLKLRRFTNIKPNHIAEVPPIATVTQANFGNQLLLHGYTVLDNGDLLLFWERSTAAEPADIQITGEVWADETPIIHLPDQRPAGYDYPVARWPVGTLVMGRIPAATWLGHQVIDGTYKLRLSVYTVTLGELHKLLLPNGHDFIELAPLIVRLD